MGTDTLSSDKYSSAFEKLHDIFEKELIDELKTFPIAEFKGDLMIGKASDEADFIPLVLNGSMRTVRYDAYGNEVVIYDINLFQSCIISITSVLMPDIKNGYTISNEDVAFIMIPKSTIVEWMNKYNSWLEFTFKLNEIRMDELVVRNKQVSEKNKEITDSIAYAKRIQSAILPPARLVKEYLGESFILYIPKDQVAGDFYWLEHKNGKVFFAAADCTGHGVPGAMVSVICNNGLNRSVREFGLTDPSEILNNTRELVIQEFEKSDEEMKDGMDIALCSLKGNKLQYAGAHNPLWIVRNGEILETKADKQPIGKYDHAQPYTNHSLELEKGDSLYIFLDGYVDQFGGPKGKKFMTKPLKQLLVDIQDKSMEEQKKIINQSFEEWKGNEVQVDDVCMIGVKF